MNLDTISVDEIIGKVGTILDDTQRSRGILIQALHKIQEEEGYLSEETLKALSEKFNIPPAEIYSVASFYSQYHFSPRGKKIVRVCVGTACHVRGASMIVEALESHFDIKQGNTTPDLKLTLETVGCIGCCGLAPVATVNEEITGEVGPEQLKVLIKEIEEG